MSQQQNADSNSSVIINLENLQKKYSNLLLSYNSSVTDYVNYLSQQSTTPEFVSIQGQSYNGTGSAGQSNATNLQDCIASCSGLPTCTGATFVSNKCLIRIGDSPLVSSTNDSYAIIPKSQQLLLAMENINTQLLSVNEQLLKEISQAKPLYYKTNKKVKFENEKLKQSYENLIEERTNITQLLKQYDTLDSVQNQTEIQITQNYYFYILLIIIVIVIIFLLGKVSIPSSAEQSGGKYMNGNLFDYL